MRTCYILLVAAAALLASVDGVSADSNQIETATITSINTTISANDNDAFSKRSLRVVDTDDDDDELDEAKDEDGDSDSDQDDDNSEEERFFGRAVSYFQNVAIIKQIRKGVDQHAILAKMGATPIFRNGFKVYSKQDPQYQRYTRLRGYVKRKHPNDYY